MARPRILVIDDSPAMRETLCVLLGRSYDVQAVATSEIDAPAVRSWDLVIAPVQLYGATGLPAGARLWLGGSPDVGGLPRRFTPSELRRRVVDAMQDPALDPAPDDPRNWRLQQPFLDSESLDVATRARTSRLALHIWGEPGSGKHAVARAIHEGCAGPLLICDDANPVPPLTEIRPDTTLLAIGVDRWPNASRRALSALLAAPVARQIRVISTATRDLAEMIDSAEFLPDLYYQLTLLTLHLRPLRDRTADIPAIAYALGLEIAERLARPRPTFAADAVQRLSHYMWFGNVAELQAVLTRSLALTGERQIAAEHLRFDGARLPAQHASPPSDSAPADPAGPIGEQATTADLKLVIHELAHEFKNPLVTIKTFTQHCQRSLPETQPDEIEFAAMTNRAVDQMDNVLENLLTFARMPQPTLRDVGLGDILRRLLAANSDLHLDCTEPPPVAVRVDPEQVSYALDNMLRAFGRGTTADKPVSVQFCAPDSLLCQLPAGIHDNRDTLKQLVVGDGDGDNEDETHSDEMPLGISIASAILQRNGAEFRLSRNGEPKTVMIRFPLVENEEEAEANRNGTSPSIDR